MRAISPELLNAVFSGIVLIIGAAATFTANRARRVTEDAKAVRRALRELQKKYVAALQHLFHLETRLAERGLTVPTRPALLEAEDDDAPVAPDPVLPPPPQPAAESGNG